MMMIIITIVIIIRIMIIIIIKTYHAQTSGIHRRSARCIEKAKQNETNKQKKHLDKDNINKIKIKKKLSTTSIAS